MASEQLTPAGTTGRDWGARAREVLVVLAAFAVVGVIAGWFWHWWWAPAPHAATDVVTLTGRPVFDDDVLFRGTGLYLCIAVVVGLVLAGLFVYLFDRDPVVTLAAVLAGAVLGGFLMGMLGSSLGPDDPPEKITKPSQLEGLEAALEVEPAAEWTAMPAGALTGAVLVLVVFRGRRVVTNSR